MPSRIETSYRLDKALGLSAQPTLAEHTEPMQQRIVPHARTLRNAREHIKQMVASGFSTLRTMGYLYQWASWWTQTALCWTKHELLHWFLATCWDTSVSNVARTLLNRHECLASTVNVEVGYSPAKSVLILAAAH